ncbi:MAG: DUF4097 family beta strand repeat-containing protein [Eubacteriales bacterium]|nr:DUF4097 family beta strand repeat-containing protein [Eubacteriales bacterium]
MSSGVKAIIIVAGTIFAIILFVFIGGMIVGAARGDSSQLGFIRNSSKTETLSPDSLKTLEISAGSANVVFHDTDGEPYVEYSIRSKGLAFGNSDLEISKFAERTTIKTPRFVTLFGYYKCDIDIWCSKSLIKHIDLSLSSGSAKLNGYEFDTAEFGLSSGNLDIGDIEANTVKIKMSSGKAAVKGLKVDMVKCTLLSGSLTMTDITAEEAYIGTSSGSTELSGSIRNIDVSLSSGKMKIETDIMPSELNCTASSGRIEVAVPESAEGFTLDYKRSSGSIKTDFPLTGDILGNSGTAQYGEGKNKVTARVSSGTISIKKR